MHATLCMLFTPCLLINEYGVWGRYWQLTFLFETIADNVCFWNGSSWSNGSVPTTAVQLPGLEHRKQLAQDVLFIPMLLLRPPLAASVGTTNPVEEQITLYPMCHLRFAYSCLKYSSKYLQRLDWTKGKRAGTYWVVSHSMVSCLLSILHILSQKCSLVDQRRECQMGKHRQLYCSHCLAARPLITPQCPRLTQSHKLNMWLNL